ncbi:MAG TPA: hypothetical protein VMJ93_04995 [Verrucomicrobiae bacterium]|nr:hypothetical protein [Verrucomicrobiae bacterium]
MPNKPATSPAADPLRWTYAGALDDMVLRYPWPKIKLNKRSLDVLLAYGVVYGTMFLLNDGYLALHPACSASLNDSFSPLRILIGQKYLRVLSRNESRSLVKTVTLAADQGIQSYKKLLSDKKRWKAVQSSLESVQEDLTQNSLFIGWPPVDITVSYRELIRYIATLSEADRGLPNVRGDVFQKVVDHFETRTKHSTTRARSKWEESAITVTDSRAQLQSLMQLGNEVYHHNFGIALDANLPSGLADGSTIAVQTRVSRAFDHLYKTYAPKVTNPRNIPPPIQLPGRVDYSNGNLLIGLLEPGHPAGKARSRYLKTRAQFLSAKADAEEMKDAATEYQAKLNEYLATFSPKGTVATHTTNLALSAGVIALGVTGLIVAPVPAIVVGGVACLVTEFGVPVLMEKWSLPQKLDRLELPKPFKARKMKATFADRHALTSYEVDRKGAQGIASKMQPFR